MKLSHRVTITVPSTMGLAQSIDNTEYVNRVAHELAELCGGARIIDNITGYYIAENGEEIIEKNTDILAFLEPLDDDKVEKIIRIVTDLKHDMRQESILYQIDDIAYIE